MWIKTHGGRLLHLERLNEIYILPAGDTEFQVRASQKGSYLNSYLMKTFKFRQDAEKYIGKLAKKLSAEEI